jgi:hypothetical protein
MVLPDTFGAARKSCGQDAAIAVLAVKGALVYVVLRPSPFLLQLFITHGTLVEPQNQIYQVRPRRGKTRSKLKIVTMALPVGSSYLKS